jgi:hypothetical protein
MPRAARGEVGARGEGRERPGGGGRAAARGVCWLVMPIFCLSVSVGESSAPPRDSPLVVHGL